MEYRNKLKFTGQEVQEILDKALLRKEQLLTDDEKQTVKKNLGVKDVDLSGYTTKGEVEKAIADAVNAIPTPDVSGQIGEHNTNKDAHPSILQSIEDVRNEMPNKVSELENDKGYLTQHQDISHLATKEEMNKKQDWIEDLEEIRQNANREIPTKLSQLDNDEGFLKEHQDISHLATKEEMNKKQDWIEDLEEIRQNANREIPTKLSQLDNDEGFLKEHQDVSHLATKEDLIDVEANALQAKNDASIAKTEAIKASTNASEALRQAQVSTDAIATLKGLENSDEAMAIIAAEITKIAQNSSDIKGLKEMIVIMTEEEYEAMEDIDQSKIYMLY